MTHLGILNSLVSTVTIWINLIQTIPFKKIGHEESIRGEFISVTAGEEGKCVLCGHMLVFAWLVYLWLTES